MEQVKIFNNRLKELYGVALDGKPRFRVVWSEDLTEKRFFPEYHLYSPGGIWLGIERNVVKEDKKYNYIKDRWIMEVYDPAQAINPEIRAGDFYEPIFVFDKKGQYLKPEWFAIEYIVKRYFAALEMPKRTEAMDRREDEADLEHETQRFMDYLEDESSNWANKFRYQEAVIIHREDN
jgi:hypothetical protein